MHSVNIFRGQNPHCRCLCTRGRQVRPFCWILRYVGRCWLRGPPHCRRRGALDLCPSFSVGGGHAIGDRNAGLSVPILGVRRLTFYRWQPGIWIAASSSVHQHCTNAVALYWANGNEQTALVLIRCQCWPIIAANIGPTLALYTTTLGHAWLPTLGQHCDNAVALCWANEQTALGLCWPIIAANIGPTLALCTTTLYIGSCLASHIGPTLRQCSGPILGQSANCIVPMLGANVGRSLLPIWANIGLLAGWELYVILHHSVLVRRDRCQIGCHGET